MTHWPRSWDYPDEDEDDERQYWGLIDEYDEPEDMTDDDWDYWLEVVGT